MISGQVVGVAAATGPQVHRSRPWARSTRARKTLCRHGRLRRGHVYPGPRRHPDHPGHEPRRRLHRHAHDHHHVGA